MLLKPLNQNLVEIFLVLHALGERMFLFCVEVSIATDQDVFVRFLLQQNVEVTDSGLTGDEGDRWRHVNQRIEERDHRDS